MLPTRKEWGQTGTRCRVEKQFWCPVWDCSTHSLFPHSTPIMFKQEESPLMQSHACYLHTDEGTGENMSQMISVGINRQVPRRKGEAPWGRGWGENVSSRGNNVEASVAREWKTWKEVLRKWGDKGELVPNWEGLWTISSRENDSLPKDIPILIPGTCEYDMAKEN